MRKYEIHLPLSSGTGEQIEQGKIARVRDELAAAFGSFAVPHRRFWRYDGVKCIEIVKLELLTNDDQVPKKFLQDLKENLKESLQIDILITTHRIQTT